MFMRSHHITRVLYVSIALFLQPCGPCTDWYYADLESNRDFKAAGLDVFENGAKAKVTAYRDYDIITDTATKVKGDKRLCMAGTNANSPGSLSIQGPSGGGLFSLGVTLALDSMKGLKDFNSEAYALAGYPDGNQEIAVRYRVSLSFEEGGPDVPGLEVLFCDFSLGSPVIGIAQFPGASEVDVRLEQDETSLTFMARETPEPGAEGNAPFQQVSVMKVPAVSFFTGIGARGLDKGGRFYADNMWFIGPSLGGPPRELGYTEDFGEIALCLEDAKEILSDNPGLSEVSFADALVGNAFFAAQSLMSSLKSDLKSSSPLFADGTQAKLAAKQANALYKKLHKVQNGLAKILSTENVKEGKIAGLCKTIGVLRDKARVGQANMQGYKAKNIKQLGFLWQIDSEYLPRFIDGF
jgi:hypothetical protein